MSHSNVCKWISQRQEADRIVDGSLLQAGRLLLNFSSIQGGRLFEVGANYAHYTDRVHTYPGYF